MVIASTVKTHPLPLQKSIETAHKSKVFEASSRPAINYILLVFLL
jgi:hypothetical protein